MPDFNKLKIRSNFSKAAIKYDDHAFLQKIVAEEMLQIWDLHRMFSKQKLNILDLGSGTGFVIKKIIEDFGNHCIFALDISEKMLNQAKISRINNIVGDIENLPLKPKPYFDIVLSSLSFQWLNRLDLAIKDIASVIKPGGFFIFSILLEGSLVELKKASSKSGANLSINEFISQESLGKILKKYFDNFEVRNNLIEIKYKNCYDLLKSIKSIGASYGSGSYRKISKSSFIKLNDFYLKNFFTQNGVSASWNIGYVLGATRHC